MTNLGVVVGANLCERVSDFGFVVGDDLGSGVRDLDSKIACHGYALINGDIVRSRDAVPPGSAVVRYSGRPDLGRCFLRCQLLPTLVTWIVRGYFHGLGKQKLGWMLSQVVELSLGGPTAALKGPMCVLPTYLPTDDVGPPIVNAFVWFRELLW